MWHLYCDPAGNWSALDRDCAANTCHDIEWDDRRWNGCASSLQVQRGISLPYEHSSFSRDRPAVSCCHDSDAAQRIALSQGVTTRDEAPQSDGTGHKIFVTRSL
jgi:hypothetical protein